MPRMASVTWRVLLAAALYALFGALVSHLFTRFTGLSRWTLLPGGPSQYFSALLSINLVVWGSWCLLAAVVFALGRRVRFDREGWWKTLAFHAVASILITTAHIVITSTGRVWLQEWWGGDPQWWPSVRDAFLRQLDQELPVYWALLGLQHAGPRRYPRLLAHQSYRKSPRSLHQSYRSNRRAGLSATAILQRLRHFAFDNRRQRNRSHSRERFTAVRVSKPD